MGNRRVISRRVFLVVLALVIAFSVVGDTRAQAAPPTPPALVFSEITTNSFLATLTAVAGCDTEDVVVTYRPTGDAQAAWIAVASGTCSDLDGEYSIVGLEALTQYEVRIQTTLDGSDEALETDSLVTTEPVAQAAVDSISLSNIANTSVTLTIYYSGGCTDSGARLFYRYRSGGSWNGSSTPSGSSPQTFSIATLTPGTAYQVQTFCTNNANLHDDFLPSGSGWAAYPTYVVKRSFTTTRHCSNPRPRPDPGPPQNDCDLRNL